MNSKISKTRVETWVISVIYNKIKEMAAQEERSLQSMVRLLIYEALKWRELKKYTDKGEVCDRNQG